MREEINAENCIVYNENGKWQLGKKGEHAKILEWTDLRNLIEDSATAEISCIFLFMGMTQIKLKCSSSYLYSKILTFILYVERMCMTMKNISNEEMALDYPVLSASLDIWYFRGCVYERYRLLFGAGVLWTKPLHLTNHYTAPVSSAWNQLAWVDLFYHRTAPVKDRFPPPNYMQLLNAPSGALPIVWACVILNFKEISGNSKFIYGVCFLKQFSR